MSLDRDAARALFGNAEPTPPAGHSPFAAASPFGAGADEDLIARVSGKSARKGPDWRLAAPVGVAALCAVAVLVVASRRDDARSGKTVAAVDIARPAAAPAPIAPSIDTPPIEIAEAAPPAPVVEPSAPTIRTRVRAEPARRAPPPRAVARAPSAADAAADVGAREPYVPPPSLGAPAQVTITPVAPPPVATPETPPATSPQP